MSNDSKKIVLLKAPPSLPGDHRGVMSLLYHLRLEKKLELEEKRAKVHNFHKKCSSILEIQEKNLSKFVFLRT